MATFAKHLAHGLVDLGHDVEVVSLTLTKPRSTREEGILVHRVLETQLAGGLTRSGNALAYSKYVLGTSNATWSKFLELHRRKPFDVLDTPEHLAEGIWPAITKVVPLTVRLYTPHSKMIAERFHNVRPSCDHQLVAAIERIAMLQADVLTSPSDDLADFVSLDLNYPRERIRLIRNPIDPGEFTPDGGVAIQADSRKTVLFVGRLEERKGIHYLIDAIPHIVSRHNNVRFIIVGDDTKTGEGQTSVLDKLKEKVRQTHIENYIEWVPRVPLDALPAYYRSADICVVPSLYDNSPYTCLEAMACGRAIVGTSAGGTREYIVNGESGIIVPPRDAESLAKGILELLNDDERRAALGRAARERVLGHFQRTEIARQTVQVYQEAIANFQKRADYKMYRRDPSLLNGDTEQFMEAFNEYVQDMLFLEPICQMAHYARLFKSNPRLSLQGLALAVTRMFFGRQCGDWQIMRNLQRHMAEPPSPKQSADSAKVPASHR
jgi:glycosyltransferase involved in cell wall biosynthesis